MTKWLLAYVSLCPSDSQNSCGSAQPSCPIRSIVDHDAVHLGKAPFPVANIRCNPAVLPDSPVPVPHTLPRTPSPAFLHIEAFDLSCAKPDRQHQKQRNADQKHYAQPASSPKPFAPSPPFLLIPTPFFAPVFLFLFLSHCSIFPSVRSSCRTLFAVPRAPLFSFYTIFS